MSEIQELNADEIKAKEYIASLNENGDEGEIKLDSLTDEQADLVYKIYNEKQGENKVDEGQAESNTTENEETKHETPQKESESPEIQPLDKDKKIAELLSELNRERQIARDRDKKLVNLKEDPEYRKSFFGEDSSELKIDPDKDYLSDEYLAQVDQLKNEITSLKKWKDDRESRESVIERDNAIKSEQLAIFDEINKLQSEFPVLKTKESFKSIDDKFVEWNKVASLGGIESDKYFSDDNYRKEAIDKGYKLNIDDSDLDKVYKIYKSYGNYNEAKAQGYKTSLSREFKDLPDYEELVKSKYLSHELADNEEFVKKLEEKSREANIMGPGSNGPDKMNEAQVEALLDEMTVISHMTNPSTADNKRFDEINKILDNLNAG